MVLLDKPRVRGLSVVWREGHADVSEPDQSLQGANLRFADVSNRMKVPAAKAISGLDDSSRRLGDDPPVEIRLSAGLSASDNSQALRATVAISTALRFRSSWQPAYRKSSLSCPAAP
jgi:hypothetical protein